MEEVQITGEFIQLNQLLKKIDWAMSGGEAKMLIEDGEISVNGATAHEIRKKIRPGDVVSFGGQSVKIID